MAGVVSEVGESVSDLNIGDRVYGYPSLLAGGSGSFAEFVVAPRSTVATAPKKIGVADAAALPLVGVSALQALEHTS